MKVDLDKTDLINLIVSVDVDLDMMIEFKLEECNYGKLFGFPNESWTWNKDVLLQETNRFLWGFYKRLKNFTHIYIHEQG